MRRRVWVWSAAAVVAAGAVVGGYAVAAAEGEDQVVESLRTTAAYVRDVEHALTFDATTASVTRVEPGATTLMMVAAVDPLILYDLVPSLEAGGVSGTASITGRRGTFACGALAVLDTVESSDGATLAPAGAAPQGGGGAARSESSDPPGDTPVTGAAPEVDPAVPAGQWPRLRCDVPVEVEAYVGLEATVQVDYRTPAGARKTLRLLTAISSETAPSTVVDDHRVVRAAVDPALLYQLTPAVDAAQVTGTGAVVGRDQTFTCEAVTLDDSTLDDGAQGVVAAPEQASVLAPQAETVDGGARADRAVSCRVPADVELYDGVAVRLRVSTARVTDALVVPLTAIRTTSVGTGIVALVTGTAADGTQTTANRVVTLGLDDGLVVAVTDGLVDGDVVVDPISQT